MLKLGLQGRAVVPKSNLSVTCVLTLLKRAKKLSSARGTAESTCTDTVLVDSLLTPLLLSVWFAPSVYTRLPFTTYSLK